MCRKGLECVWAHLTTGPAWLLLCTLAHTWTPLLNSSPASLPRSDVQPLGLGRENCHGDNPQALELSIGSFSQFFGNCHKIGSTTKEANEAWGPNYPRQSRCPSKNILGSQLQTLGRWIKPVCSLVFLSKFILLLRTINSSYCFPCSQGPWVDKQSLMISEQI